MPGAETPNDINGKYQAMKFAEWKGAIGEKVEGMDDRLVRVESKLDKLIPRVAGIGATIALIVTILVLLTRSAFGTLTDFSFADRDTVLADKDMIIYDYHFKIYRTDTIASWAIEVDDYESFACYIEGYDLPHSDSFAMAAVYYQSGTYDSLFSRISGYERSILDTAITDTIGQWHTFYPLLKYVKIYIYGDTIGTAANPVSSADSNTVRVRVRLSKWKGTMKKIPGTGVYAHHHSTFDDDVTFRAQLLADTIWLTTLMVSDTTGVRQGAGCWRDWRRQGVGFWDWRREGLGNPGTMGWRAVTL